MGDFCTCEYGRCMEHDQPEPTVPVSRIRNAIARLDGHTCHAGHTDADHLRLYRQVVAEIEGVMGDG